MPQISPSFLAVHPHSRSPIICDRAHHSLVRCGRDHSNRVLRPSQNITEVVCGEECGHGALFLSCGLCYYEGPLERTHLDPLKQPLCNISSSSTPTYLFNGTRSTRQGHLQHFLHLVNSVDNPSAKTAHRHVNRRSIYAYWIGHLWGSLQQL